MLVPSPRKGLTSGRVAAAGAATFAGTLAVALGPSLPNPLTLASGPSVPLALTGALGFGMARDAWRYRFGSGISQWAAKVGVIAKEVLARQDGLAGPDKTPVRVERWEPIEHGMAAEVWAGNNMAALRDYVDGPFVRQVNLVNRRRVSGNPDRWLVAVARLVPDVRVPGKAKLVLLRVDPLWAVRPWPYAPGVCPIERFEDAAVFGWSRWGDRITLPVMDVGPHILISGGTGAGKSGGIHVLLGGNWLPLNLSPQGPTVVTVLGDFKGGAELKFYRRMANGYATTVPEMRRLLKRTVKFLQLRGQEWGDDDDAGRRMRRFTPAEPAVVVLVDELAPMLRDKECAEALGLINALGRAVGVISVGATQYPKDEIVPSEVRVNYPIRVAYRIGTLAEAKVQLGEPPELTSEHGPHTIPELDERYKGVCYLHTLENGLDACKTDWIDDDWLRQFRAAMDEAGNPKPEAPWLDGDEWWQNDPRLADPKPAGRGRSRGKAAA